MYVTQEMLLDILERHCRLENEEDCDPFFAAMSALEYSPREERDREALARLIRCLYDDENLNPVFSDLVNLCYDYGASLGRDHREGEEILLEEAVKAAPEMLDVSPTFFGGEFFQMLLNSYREDAWRRDCFPVVVRTMRNMHADRHQPILRFLRDLAVRYGKSGECKPEETDYGKIFLYLQRELGRSPAIEEAGSSDLTSAGDTVSDLVRYLDRCFPASLAEEWDNVGLLVGDPTAPVRKVLTCLTVTPVTVAEAIREKADLVVTHHPFPFHATKRLTRETTEGGMLLDLISSGIAVYSPHTAHDSAADGINEQLAVWLDLRDVKPLRPSAEDATLGSGRIGRFERACVDEQDGVKLYDLVRNIMRLCEIRNCQYVGDPKRKIKHLAIACGAADEFVRTADEAGADALLLGEARFHTVLEAEALGLALILPGHYASERFALESLAERIGREFPMLCCRASRAEYDPIRTL